jgi:hypothetical protein
MDLCILLGGQRCDGSRILGFDLSLVGSGQRKTSRSVDRPSMAGSVTVVQHDPNLVGFVEKGWRR